MKKHKIIGVPLALTLSALIPLTAASVEERLKKQELELQAIREQLDDVKNSSNGAGWPSWFSLNGEWEIEYVDAESDPNSDASANSHGRFQNDKFSLKPKIKLSKNLYIKGELKYSTSGAQMEEYHAHFTGLPLNSYVQIGLDERFSKADGKFDMADRKTEGYPLLGTAFWRDEQLALIWGGKNKLDSMVKDVFWRAHVSNGLELSEKQTNENDSYEIAHDNDLASDTDDKKTEWGFGLGFTFQPADNYTFDVAGWHIESELNQDDKSHLAGVTGYIAREGEGLGFTNPSVTSPELFQSRQQRTGFRTTHKMGYSTVTYEIAKARDGAFKRKGYYVQASHKFSFKPLFAGEFVKSVEPLIRFEEYGTNIAPVYGESEVWDRKQTMYALLVGLTSSNSLKSTLKLEYAVNDERTGALPGVATQSDDPNNDEFLAQLELKF